jgi:hypothetical protein
MGTNNPNQCIESFRDALKRAGLEERRADVSPGLMAHGLRPRTQTRSSTALRDPRGKVRRNFSMSFWILILAFVFGLAPAIAIGAFVWTAKSRGTYEYSCSSRMAATADPSRPIDVEVPSHKWIDASVTET